MSKKYLFLTVLCFVSAVVVAGVQGITSLMGNSEDESVTYREIYAKSIDVKEAIAICEETGETATADFYYVRGTVSSVSINLNYGDATIYLEQIDEEAGEEYSIQLYQVRYFNGEKFTEADAIQEGDEVIAYGQLVNYKSNTPEMAKGGYIVAVNGKLSEQGEGTDPENPVVQMDTVTIFVDAEEAPYLYTWGKKEIAEWPGVQMTEQAEVGGIKFWTAAIPVVHSGSLVSNGDLEGEDVTNFISKEYPSPDMVAARIVDGAGVNNSRCIVVKTADENDNEEAQAWDSQFWIYFNEPLSSGRRIHVEFDYRANKESWASTEAHQAPGEFLYWGCIGDVYFDTEWQHFSETFQVAGDMIGMQSIAFSLAENQDAVEYYFDNIVVSDVYNSLNIIFNDGDDYQTEDINNVEGTRYYWYSGKRLYKDVTDEVLAGKYNTPMIEECIINYDYKYFNDGDSLLYNNVKLAFYRNNGNQPRNYYGEILFYNGNSMTFVSDVIMTDIQFYTDYDESYYVRGEASEGELKPNHWTGETTELTITNNTGSQQRFNRFVVTFDNPTNEELVARLASQVELTEAAIAALSHSEVYGKTALAQMIEDAKILLAMDEPNYDLIRKYIRDLKQALANIQKLDDEYTVVEVTLDSLAATAQNNQYVDPAKLEAGTAFIAETRNGIAQGKYSEEDLKTIWEIIDYQFGQLEMVYLTIALADAGTLGDEILSRVPNFTDVQGLRLSGTLDDNDFNNIKNRLTNLQEIDLTQTTIKNLPNSLFYNHNILKNVKLPANLETIGSSAFYSCYNLQNVELPATLKTIGEYAFQYCDAITEVNVPEGVTSIGYEAFYSRTGWDYVYDEYGNYKRDENGNYIRIYYGSNLKKVSLPSTLTYLGSSAFYNCRNLVEVNIPEGLATIESSTFAYCSSLKSITLPASIKRINSEAFSNSGLISVELSEGVNYIGNYAFGNCDSLISVVLPSSVNSVNYPFNDCNNLTSITVKSIVPPYANNNDIMYGLEQNCSLYVPQLSVASYKQTDYWSKFAPNIFGVNIMPENIIISDTYRLMWPDTVSFDYKPNVELTKMDLRTDDYYYYYDSRYRYAAVTVTGNATLSAKEFSMYYDFYQKYQSNSSEYSRFASLINNGKIRTDNNTLKLHLQADRWQFIALPFDVKVSDIVNVNNTDFVIRGYDVVKRANSQMSETWVPMTGDDILEAGKGYIWQAAHIVTEYTDENGDVHRNENYDVEFDVQALQTVNKNNMFVNTNVEIELEENVSEFAQNRSWNFIGNPYPCYFDTRAIDCTAPITVWNVNNRNYSAYSPVDDNYILTPGEAFFIQRPIDQASITFVKEGRQLNPQVRDITYFAGSRQSGLTAQRSVFNLKIEGEEQLDQTRFVINNEASLEYEMDKDASKFMDATVNGVQMYTIEDGLNYAINERPMGEGIITLGVKFMKSGIYTIKLDTSVEQEVYIIDLLTGNEVLLTEAGYAFQAEAGTADNRFVLRLGIGEVTGIQNMTETDSEKEIYFDLQGRQVMQPNKGIYLKKGKKVVVK